MRPPDLSAALKPSRHGTSYSHLLPSSPSLPFPSTSTSAAASSLSLTSGDGLAPIDGLSEPIALDDPNIVSGRHRVVLALPGLRSSIISFVRGKELKRELNEQFRLKHSWLNPSMSLSKLRRCKLLLLGCGLEVDLELSTVALAYVYLERLCWRNLVEKKNRKLLAAVCLTLAYKYNEGAQQTQRKKQFTALLAAAERLLDVRRTDVLKHELCTPAQHTLLVLPIHRLLLCCSDGLSLAVLVSDGWVALDFDLSVSPRSLLPHFQQLLLKSDTHVAAQYQQLQWSTMEV